MAGFVELVGGFGMRRCGRVLAVALALVLGLATMAGPQATADERNPVVLRVTTTQSIDSLNPFLAILASSAELMRLMYESLTVYDAHTQQPVPGLAEKWTASPDKLTWTFTIRHGARWSDGEPITARDVAFTYDLLLRDANARTANGSFVASVESVSAPDPYTVVIKTASPQATVPMPGLPIVPEHIWANVDDIGDYRNDRMPVVGSGPFVLTDYVPEQFITLRANDEFWRGRPKIDELQFVMFKNTDAAVQALRQGEVDVIGAGSTGGGLTPAQFEALANDPDVARNRASGRQYVELAMNPGAATRDGTPIGDGHPALRDVRVRQAIALAIDRDALVDRVLDGFGQPGESVVPPMFPDFHWSPPDPSHGFDPERANEMLDQAGYPRGGDGVRVGPDGRPLRFRLISRSGGSPIGQFVQGWLADIGIAVELQPTSGTRLDELTSTGSYDLAISGWGVHPDPDYVLSIHTCGQRPGPDGTGGTTAAFFCDPRYDALYARQLAEFDRDARAALVRQMQQRLYDQAPTVVLFYADALEAYRSDRFAPFQVQPDPGGVITGQSGYWGLYSATPQRGIADDGGSSIVWVGLGAAAVVGLGAAVLTLRRRRATADDRE